MASNSLPGGFLEIGITSDALEDEGKVVRGSRISFVFHGELDNSGTGKHATVCPCSNTKITCPTRMAIAIFKKGSKEEVGDVSATIPKNEGGHLSSTFSAGNTNFEFRDIPLVLGRQGKIGDRFQSSLTKNRGDKLDCKGGCTPLQSGGKVPVLLVDDL